MSVTNTRVRVVTGVEAVLALLRNLPSDMSGTAFQHPIWSTCWSDTPVSGGRRLIAAVVEEAGTGRLLFVLPLALAALGAVHYWTPLDGGVSDYNASLTAADFRPDPTEMRELWRRIVAVLPHEASFLMIDKVPLEIAGRPEPLAELAHLRRSHVIRHPLRLDTDFETLRATRFCQTTMRSLARKRRKLERKGRLAFEIDSGPAAVPMLERLMTWRAERYGDNPATTAFYRRLLDADAPVRVARLSLDGEPIAAGFGALESGAFRLLALGHDERFKNWSPGLLLIEDTIAWATGLGLAEFDFTIGSESYKFAFGVVPEPLWLVTEEFGPQGSAMLHLLLTRNALAKKLKRWIKVHGPRDRSTRTAAE